LGGKKGCLRRVFSARAILRESVERKEFVKRRGDHWRLRRKGWSVKEHRGMAGVGPIMQNGSVGEKQLVYFPRVKARRKAVLTGRVGEQDRGNKISRDFTVKEKLIKKTSSKKRFMRLGSDRRGVAGWGKGGKLHDAPTKKPSEMRKCKTGKEDGTA